MEKDSDELAFADYWNHRYVEKEGEDTYDWFRDWEQLGAWFKDHLSRPQANILHLGCGNSTLTADLHALGFTHLTSIDFSDVVIKSMETKYKDLNTVWKVMDVRQMDGLFDDSFDIAIDKATMDSMFHGSMWDPPDDVRENIERYLGEVVRVLVPGGTFLYITYRQPHFLKPLLARKDWNLSVETLPDRQRGVFEYFAYVMKKFDVEEDSEDASEPVTDSGSETGKE
ncbi:MAG: hypothetical protein ALECFALPRED_005189 [Alectoria fallacina]|uniref:Methyltransferase domain-containing protein n=1 Tax=Alectoria fallacina TaxID=1903189 RepID=A0A8H3ICY2_9LECA|nr:MAG: hypothetical protein ALECFALPRED_005189 [Alectoria fallacina]